MQTKMVIILVVIIAIIGMFSTMAVHYKTTISSLETELKDVKDSNKDLLVKLTVEESNNVKLKSSIEKVNTELNRVKVRNETIQTELEKWQKGEVSVTKRTEALDKLLNSKLYIDPACQHGLMINQLLGDIKYEDL